MIRPPIVARALLVMAFASVSSVTAAPQAAALPPAGTTSENRARQVDCTGHPAMARLRQFLNTKWPASNISGVTLHITKIAILSAPSTVHDPCSDQSVGQYSIRLEASVKNDAASATRAEADAARADFAKAGKSDRPVLLAALQRREAAERIGATLVVYGAELRCALFGADRNAPGDGDAKLDDLLFRFAFLNVHVGEHGPSFASRENDGTASTLVFAPQAYIGQTNCRVLVNV